MGQADGSIGARMTSIRVLCLFMCAVVRPLPD